MSSDLEIALQYLEFVFRWVNQWILNMNYKHFFILVCWMADIQPPYSCHPPPDRLGDFPYLEIPDTSISTSCTDICQDISSAGSDAASGDSLGYEDGGAGQDDEGEAGGS